MLHIKKIALCSLGLLLITAVAVVSVSFKPSAAEPVNIPPEKTRNTRVSVSNDPDAAITLSVTDDNKGVTVTAKTKYNTLFSVSQVSSSSDTDTATREADGSYSCTVRNIVFDGNGRAQLLVWFQGKNGGSTHRIGVPVTQDAQGLYFPGSDLAEKNAAAVNGARKASDTAAAYYVSDSLDTDETYAVLNELRALALDITKGKTTQYAKARAISEWVAQNISYDESQDKNIGDISVISLAHVLKERKTICYGYSNITAALMTAVGIKAVAADGVAALAEEPHSLLYGDNAHEHSVTAFYCASENGIGGEWHLCDTTWDSKNVIYNNGRAVTGKEGCHIYFDMSDTAFAFAHKLLKAEQRDYFGSLRHYGRSRMYILPEWALGTVKTATR